VSAWIDLAVTVLATWPPAAVAFYANWVKTKNHVAAVADEQNQSIAAITSTAVTGQNADFRKIAEQVAEEQTKQLVDLWPPAKSDPQVEAAASTVALEAGKEVMHYVIAPAKRHVDAWLRQSHIDPSVVTRVTNPDVLDALEGATVVVLNPSGLTGPAAESAEKARELAAQGKVTLRTDQT
jgi:hypothetical protein